MTTTDLSSVGNVVDPGYRHVVKEVRPGSPLVLPSAYFKWYLLCRPDQEVDPDVDGQARDFVAGLGLDGDLGFVIHHLSGEDVHLLLVFTWRGNNEMWESVFVLTEGRFEPMSAAVHRGAFCVWEFAAIAHEHEAWTRYLRSERGPADKMAYAGSQFTGTI